MKNRTKVSVAAVILAVMVFSTGCPPGPPRADNTQNGAPAASPTAQDDRGPSECTISGINRWITDKRAHGPLSGQSELNLEAVPFELTTYNEKGVEQKATYAHLIVSGKVIDRLNGNSLPTFPALNGIIQPLVKNRGADKGPCVTAVKYVTLQTKTAPASDDFLWSYCPVGSQVCSDGTCSQYCKGGTGGIGR